MRVFILLKYNYYGVADSLYKTVFPDDEHPDSLVFSGPVNVGKISDEN